MRKLLALFVCLLMISGSLVRAEGPSVASLPPSIIKTAPACGDLSVDANATARIEVTFSKDMQNDSYSWAQVSSDTFPQVVASPRFLADKRTCVLEVKLKPKKTYVIWINSEKYRNFKDLTGNAAVPYLLVFQTK